MPAREAAAELAKRRAAERKDEFGRAWRRYEQAFSLRAAAVNQGNLDEVRKAESYILAMVATDGHDAG